jgi:hypothetical protein
MVKLEGSDQRFHAMVFQIKPSRSSEAIHGLEIINTTKGNTHTMRRLLYAEKVNRDTKFAELKKSGIHACRFTTGPQQIHPQYVEDRKQGVSAADKGFGNTLYKTLFGQLYGLEWDDGWRS